MLNETQNFSRRQVLKGTLASLLGKITGADSPVASLLDTPAMLLGSETGLAEILKEANKFFGSCYHQPLRQSMCHLAKMISSQTQGLTSPSDIEKSLALEFTSHTPGSAAPNRRFIHQLLNSTSADRQYALSQIANAKCGLQKLTRLSPTTSPEVFELAAHIFFDQNCTSDDGFITTIEPPKSYFEANCKDPDAFFQSLISTAMKSLDAEELIFKQGFKLLNIARGNPTLNQSLEHLKQDPNLPPETITKIKEDILGYERKSPASNEQGSDHREAKTTENSQETQRQALIDKIVDGSIEAYPRNKLADFLGKALGSDNLCNTNHEGLMRRLDATGLVFRIDNTALLDGSGVPQVDMIWIDDAEEPPRTFNLTFHKRENLIQALVKLKPTPPL